jgi:hypothetical protein
MKTDEISARGKPITNRNRVDDIVRKFKSKYGEGEVKRYYTTFDVAVEVTLWSYSALVSPIDHIFKFSFGALSGTNQV